LARGHTGGDLGHRLKSRKLPTRRTVICQWAGGGFDWVTVWLIASLVTADVAWWAVNGNAAS
jgi:hypothetical protein